MKHLPSPTKGDHTEALKGNLKDAFVLHIFKDSYVQLLIQFQWSQLRDLFILKLVGRTF